MKLIYKKYNYISLIIALFLISISSGITFSNFQPARKSNVTKDHFSQKRVDISGIWESSIGWKYNMKQKGSAFNWIVINRNQTAQGVIFENNKDIEVTWVENSSRGTAKGVIIETNEQKKALFIEWDNGVFFHRNS